MTGPCVACKSSGLPGMQLSATNGRGRLFWRPCVVCRGRERIEIVTSAEASLAACWMPPAEVAGFKQKIKEKGL
jgi:hypothetical protein